MLKILMVAAALVFAGAFDVEAASQLRFVGVNLSGAEINNPVTGRMNYDYTYPTPAEADYFAALGENVFRVPVAWQRLQPTMNGPLAAAQLAPLEAFVLEAAKDHAGVVIDLHNYGAGYGSNVGSAQVPTSALANFWSQMATYFKNNNNNNVAFGIMNEPNQQSPAAWAAIDQAVITAIRQTGSYQGILASGSDWDGGTQWVSSGDAAAMASLTDPDDNLFIEVHQYLDVSSTGTTCNIATSGAADLAAVTSWARSNHMQLWLGEIGVCSDATSLGALKATLGFLNQNADVWTGATYWAGGPWMGNYMYSADPSGAGVESPPKRNFVVCSVNAR